MENKEKLAQSQNIWKSKNPEKVKRYQRTTNLKKFGISLQDYEKKFEQQKGLCAICKKPETFIHSRTKKIAKLAVDHCHSTGKTRGLLCKNCNTALGLFKDDQFSILSALNYLKEHNG